MNRGFECLKVIWFNIFISTCTWILINARDTDGSNWLSNMRLRSSRYLTQINSYCGTMGQQLDWLIQI